MLLNITDKVKLSAHVVIMLFPKSASKIAVLILYRCSNARPCMVCTTMDSKINTCQIAKRKVLQTMGKKVLSQVLRKLCCRKNNSKVKNPYASASGTHFTQKSVVGVRYKGYQKVPCLGEGKGQLEPGVECL